MPIKLYLCLCIFLQSSILLAAETSSEMSEKVLKAKERYEQRLEELILEMRDEQESLKAAYMKVLEKERSRALKKERASYVEELDQELTRLGKKDPVAVLFGSAAVNRAEAKLGDGSRITVNPSSIPVTIGNIWDGTQLDRTALRKKIMDTFVDPKTNTATFTLKEIQEAIESQQRSLQLSFVFGKKHINYSLGSSQDKFGSDVSEEEFSIRVYRDPNAKIVINNEIAIYEYHALKKKLAAQDKEK